MKNLFPNEKPISFICGLNVIESYEETLAVASTINEVCERAGAEVVFKASFDKANRSSGESYRGPGLDVGLKVLRAVKLETGMKVLTDVHEVWQVPLVSEVADVLQLPAFLARQTDLIQALASSGKCVNIKKPQFMGPDQVSNIVKKFNQFGASDLMICERGTMFGYDNLVVDFLGMDVIKKNHPDLPLVFDVTHSLQKRDHGAAFSGGRREQFMALARAGVSLGIATIFIECHRNPSLAKCDGPSALPLSKLDEVVRSIVAQDKFFKSHPPIVIE